jgi:outer membrane protein OmpA-like peptidoglycan-associated protein
MPPLPATPPAPVTLPPIVVQLPAAQPEAPTPPPISDTAGTSVAPIAGGLRVVFGPDRADLTAETADRLKQFAAAAPSGEVGAFNVIAYAAGPPEDPSTPRRLSLSRALAVRSVLMQAGIASPRIYVRALGSASAGGPPDRVDITALAQPGAPRKSAEGAPAEPPHP